MDTHREDSKELLTNGQEVCIHEVYFNHIGLHLEVPDQCVVLLSVVIEQFSNDIPIVPKEHNQNGLSIDFHLRVHTCDVLESDTVVQPGRSRVLHIVDEYSLVEVQDVEELAIAIDVDVDGDPLVDVGDVPEVVAALDFVDSDTCLSAGDK